MEGIAGGRLYEFDATADVYAGALVALLIKKDMKRPQGKEILERLFKPRVLEDHSLVREFFLPEVVGELVSFILVEFSYLLNREILI